MGERIRYARKQAGLTQAELAKKCGVSKGAVSLWEGGQTLNLKNENLYALAKATGFSDRWIVTGTGTKAAHDGFGNATEGPDATALPLISWVQAGAWMEAEDMYEVGDYEELIPVAGRYSTRSFILRVRGDSMVAESGPSFPEGSLIIVDPEKEAKHGSYVVVRLDSSKEVTFKQLVIDGGTTYLKPLNTRYPIIEIDESAQVCGVVRGMTYLFD